MNTEREKIKEVRTVWRLVIATALGALIYTLGLGEMALLALGAVFAGIIYAAFIDPQWALGTIARPWYEYLSNKYYDIWLHTSKRSDD